MATATVRSLELNKDEGKQLEGKLFTLQVGESSNDAVCVKKPKMLKAKIKNSAV